MNNRQVAHLWANQARPRASGSHFFFDGPTIYSYGSHFPVARHIERAGRKAVLFTSRSYSNSTARHISCARRALCGLEMPIFEMHDPSKAPRSHEIQNDYAQKVKDFAEKAVRARAAHAKQWNMHAAQMQANNGNAFSEFFGWKWRIDVPAFSPEEIAAIQERAKADAARKAEDTKRREAAKRAELAERTAAWLAGENVSLWGRPDTLLRINGDKIQTSRGAEIPVSHAPRLWRVIQKAVAGEPYQHNGHSEYAGDFRVDSIDTTGTLRAGCHTIAFPELDRIARQLGLA